MFKKYTWNVIFVVLGVAIIGFFIFDLILFHNIRNYLFEQTFREMEMKTRLADTFLEDKNIKLTSNNSSELYDITYRLRSIVHSRVTIIDISGRVLTDSDVSRDSVRFMDNHLTRPEVQQATQRGWGQSYRRSDTVKRRLFYTAFPIRNQNQNIGFLRMAYYSRNFEESTGNVVSLIISANLIGLMIIFSFALLSGRVITFPILKLVDTAQKISDGDLEKTFTVRRKDEIGTLAIILNELTLRLKTQIRQISDEQKKLEQILTHLDVGIILIDRNKEMLHVNPELFNILGIGPIEFENVNMIEIIRSEPLIHAIDEVLQKNKKKSGEFIYYTTSDKKYLRYVINPHELTGEKTCGALIQLQDITELKRLEAIRRDFVANASHELKTPLTSIIGYTETLLHGAAEDPESRIKFIRKIREQSQRLEFLIADLLKLSELDRELPVELHPVRLFSILRETVNEHKEKADQKAIEISLKSPRTVKVEADEESLRTVMNNLIDNAIKYTPQSGKIEIKTIESEKHHLRIEVSDTGIGIDPKYHERIFQRFYQIDKARSQSMGGTGLGLAIVKHIIEKHGSQIHIDSAPGKGSCFWFELNRA